MFIKIGNKYKYNNQVIRIDKILAVDDDFIIANCLVDGNNINLSFHSSELQELIWKT